MTTQVRFLECDNWIAMYIDGKKVYEGHDIQPNKALGLLCEAVPALDLVVKYKWVTDKELGGAMQDACFPEQYPEPEHWTPICEIDGVETGHY